MIYWLPLIKAILQMNPNRIKTEWNKSRSKSAFVPSYYFDETGSQSQRMVQ